MKIAGKRAGNIGYNRADLTRADLTRGRVDPHSNDRAHLTRLVDLTRIRLFSYGVGLVKLWLVRQIFQSTSPVKSGKLS